MPFVTSLLRPQMHGEGVYLKPKSRSAAPSPGLIPEHRWLRTAIPGDLRKEPGTSLLPAHQRRGDPLYRH